MRLEEIKQFKKQLNEIAAKHGIKKMYVFGSVARGDSSDVSDVDFLIEMEDSVSAFGVGAFQYEVQELLGVYIDVVPTFALRRIEDMAFRESVQSEAVSI